MASIDLPVGTPGTPGAGQDVQIFGASKLFHVDGPDDINVDIQFSEDNTNWFRLRKILVPGKYKLSVAAKWLRASIPTGGVAPTNIDIHAESAGTTGVDIPIPTAPGTGASVNISALGDFSTFLAEGLASGEVVFEVSEDDTNYLDCFTIDEDAPFYSGDIIANYARARRVDGSGETINGTLRSENNPVSSTSQSNPLLILAPFKTKTSSNMFTTTSEVDAAAPPIGYFDIFVDHTDDNGDVVGEITADLTDHPNWGRARVTGIKESGRNVIVIEEGCTFSKGIYIWGEYMGLSNRATATSPVVPATGQFGMVLDGGVISQESTAPFLSTANMSPGNNVAIEVRGRSSFLGVGTGAIAQDPTTPVVYNDGFFVSVTIFTQNQGVIMENALGAANQNTSINLIYDYNNDNLVHQPKFLTLGSGVATFIVYAYSSKKIPSYPEQGSGPATAAQNTTTQLRNPFQLRFDTTAGDIYQDLPSVDQEPVQPGAPLVTLGYNYELYHEAGANRLYGVPKLGEFMNGVESVGSSGVLTCTDLSDGDTITIDSSALLGGAARVYTIQATLTDVDGNVQLGGDLEETLANLAAHINGGAGAGTAYAASGTADPIVSAVSDPTTLTVTAKIGGSQTDVVDTTETSGTAAWGAAKLSGGAGEFLVPFQGMQRFDSRGGLAQNTEPGWAAIIPYAPSAAYAPTNVTPDRAFDADTVLIAELADVVGTLIGDLQERGILG